MVDRKAKQESKFAGIFQNAPPTAAAEPAPGRVETLPPPPIAARPLGRPPGKRSDPAWKQFSVLLKKATQREAADRLRAEDEGRDLSGLLQELLEQWVASRQQS
jgi:hypothetical protein